MAWLQSTMIFAGMLLLAMSMKPISAILAEVGVGRLYRLWRGLGVLVVLFLVGYATIGALSFGKPASTADLIVSVILLAGGGFVLVVARLSEETARDIVRIARLESEVVRDPLTGVFNRRYLDGKLEEEIPRARRSRQPLSALLIDLDHFKHVNDTYGHPIGDLVLKHVADLIVVHARVADTVARYGGEEFVVIAPDSDLDDVNALGERMLGMIAGTAIPLPGGGQLTVTASIGAASFSIDENRDQFLSHADQALYSAKRNGRNRLCTFVPDRESTAA